MGERDPVHDARQIDVGHHQVEAATAALQHKLGGFRTLTRDDVEIAFLKQQANHFPLHRIVFDNERFSAKRSCLSHWAPPFESNVG